MDHLSMIYYAFEEIKNAKGNEKLPIIKRVCDHPAIFQALITLLHPDIPLHVGKKSLLTPVNKAPAQTFDDFRKVFSYLGASETINDQKLAGIQQYLAAIPSPELRKFAVEYLAKTYSMGISAKTLNKALGREVIPLMECMLAHKFFDHPEAVEGKSFAITEKLDGIRCIAVVKPDFTGIYRVALYTRQGQRITGLKDVEKELHHLTSCYGSSLVFDGELLISDRERYPSSQQYKLTTQIVRTKDDVKTGITYHVFDMLGADAFDSKFCDTPYYLRRQKLDSLFECVDDCQHVQAVPIQYTGADVNMIYQLVETERQRQHEGVMVNLLDEPYVFGRTKALLKVKVMQDCDLKIVGFEEGEGKFAGTLGALVVDYKGVRVGVGSGLSDEVRRMFWQNQDQYVGRVATIQYFEETHDKNGIPSLRFPVFKDLCDEGKEVSYN